ncbi:hypothetical protein J7T55_005039 [Diaporthe amygdali]|uniref:uncharacterized protein n=1 Tax=Phomopsis amygdali TaxID=1214568 RepID=UPI0022FDF448|nr:uncharacterized protein J7T55_005039 [Diaporthe amygdali]KAJ0116093.1 hypothetical protein J7T55_005039 [Diaporthe amygdali]
MMASDHDQLLDRILPHVDRGAISAAKNTITDFEWDDESDSADFEEPYSLATTRSVLTRTNSDASYGVLNGGLSPSRPLRSKDFEASALEQMADIRETEGHGQTNGAAASAAASVVRSRGDAEPADPPRSKAGSRAGQVASGKSSPHHTRDTSETFGSVDVPLRHSSRPGSGSVGVPSVVDKPLPELKEPRPQHPIIVEGVEQTAHDSIENGDEQAHRGSNSRRSRSPLPPPAPSATPPPIAHKPPPHARRVVYDDFADEDDDDMDDDHEDIEQEDDEDYDDRFVQQPRVAQAYETRRGPPSAHTNNPSSRKKEGRANSIASNTSRGSRAARSRTAALARDYKGLRTPILDHLQMYQDAESKKPLADRIMPPIPQRQTHQKTYRSVDDGMYNDFSMRGNGIGSSAHEAVPGGPIRRRYSDDDVSVRSVRNSISGRTAKSSASQNMPDFFSSEIFQVVLHNPTTSYQLLKFSESRLCAENVEFLSKVDEYRTTLNNLAGQMAFIHKQFISPGSAYQINVNGTLLKKAHKEMKTLISNAFPSMETVFTDLQDQIETLVFQDIYPRFVRHQMALSATRALATDRFKYQGLGDCFCLTNPRVADNPIVFASDGFVKTTGYSRNEIVPRNCRFLQGAHTDRQPVQRLKTAINEEKESVELLLNYKKNGDPFWNLLYVAPLYNQRGKTEFFLGGQVNCSTTIHSNVDVLKVLSTSATSDAEHAEFNKPLPGPQQSNKTSARKTILKALGVRQNGNNVHIPQMDAGMENGVLGRMEGQDLSSQMKEFYTAYSKVSLPSVARHLALIRFAQANFSQYLVVRANTYVIEFYSEGIVEMLNPANMAGTMVAGSEVFRFFGLNMMAKQSEYKARVRNAIRVGMPISTELRLQTRRSAVFRGDEKFVAHWTPLKDEKAAVHYVVVTVAPLMA